MTENVMTQFKSEGEPAFPLDANKENDNSADSSTGEETIVDQTQSDDGDQKSDEDKKDDDNEGEEKSLDKHPRWKQREEDWNKRFNDQEVRHTQELEKIRKDIETKFDKKREEIADTDIPAWFGGDAAAWKQYQEYETRKLNDMEIRAIEKAEAKIVEKTTAEQKAIDDATKYFNDTVAELEADKTLNPDGTKIDRNKLLKFTLDEDLVDGKGRWNYKAAFKLMKASGTVTPKTNGIDEKKKIAGATKSENRGETKVPQYTTSADFKKPGARPW